LLSKIVTIVTVKFVDKRKGLELPKRVPAWLRASSLHCGGLLGISLTLHPLICTRPRRARFRDATKSLVVTTSLS